AIAVITLLGVSAILIWMEKSSPTLQMPGRTVAGLCLLACAFSFVLIFVSIFPGVFALSDLPPKRAQFIPHWILLTTLLCMGVALGGAAKYLGKVTPNLFASLVASSLILLLILPWALKSTLDINKVAIRESRAYAAEWDAEDAQIRKQVGLGDAD